LLDQGFAPLAAVILRKERFDAIHTSEIGMDRADDVAILERARTDERVCVTLDHDFHAHLAIAGQGRPSVILLRAEGLDAQAQANLIRLVCIRCEDALREGAAVSSNRETIRVR
jgi:predicted nuclease of predicted toxin-antitoxin system